MSLLDYTNCVKAIAREPQSVTTIANLTGINRETVRRIVGTMYEEGLIDIHATHPPINKHGRPQRVYRWSL